MAQLLSSLPIGARVKFGKYSVEGEAPQDIVWLVVAKNHATKGAPYYPSNSVTLLTEKAIDIRAADNPEPGNTENSMHREGGNPDYSLSNIDQWLNKNSAAGTWYVSTHPLDTPPSDERYGTQYVHRPGFLHAFSSEEIAVILDTTFRTKTADPSTTKDITRKVFLPSRYELKNDETDLYSDTIWEYFVSHDRGVSITQQCFDYTNRSVNKPSVTSEIAYWTRTTDSILYARLFHSTKDSMSSIYPSGGAVGVRPAMNLMSSVKVSDTMDSSGSYVVVYNSAPPMPTTLNVPATIYGGKSNSISWTKVTDPDGDAVTYRLECSVDGGDYTQIYNGAALSYAHLVPFGTSTVTYRVKATDPSGESSDYTTSGTKTVVNNNAPVISGSDSNLGVKSEGFTGTYTVTDANGNTVTVTEAIDGVRIRSLVVTLGQTVTYGVTENTWLALPNGSHTLTISATDGIDTSIRTYAFTKLVDSFKIQNSTPWVSSTMPSRIMLVVTRNIPSASTFKVEVCNNGYDTSPTWEDATDAVASGLVHVFSNTSKTATNWGVLVRVTVERNGATGACYVSAIGGNFE